MDDAAEEWPLPSTAAYVTAIALCPRCCAPRRCVRAMAVINDTTVVPNGQRDNRWEV